MCNGTTRPRGGRSLQPLHVPAAAVWFPDEVRAEILRMIDESLRTVVSPSAHRRTPRRGVRRPPRAAHAVAIASGTSALEIVLRSIGVAGREVIVPANTFHATAAAVIAAEARLRFADCDPATLGVDPASVASYVLPATAAVIVVHIGGLRRPQRPRAADALCNSGVALVEDAAHAHGSSLDGRSAGTFGVAGAFSFYPTKVMAGGEGGMIVTDDAHLADEARIYRDQARRRSSPTSTPDSAATGG